MLTMWFFLRNVALDTDPMIFFILYAIHLVGELQRGMFFFRGDNCVALCKVPYTTVVQSILHIFHLATVLV